MTASETNSGDLKKKRRQLGLKRALRMRRGGEEFLLDLVVDDLMDRLSIVDRDFDLGLALFGQTQRLASLMNSQRRVNNVLRIEEAVHEPGDNSLSRLLITNSDHPVTGVELADLAVSPLTLHFAEDLPGALFQIRQKLKPDGLFLACLPGPDTLMELRSALLTAESELSDQVGLRIDPFTDIQSAGALLQNTGFALPVVDQERLTIRYDDIYGLVRDLRAFGVSGLQFRSDVPKLTRSVLTKVSEIYREQFSDPDGRIRATVQLIYLSGWVPHESQQQPLKPGSAKTRLAEALKATEEKLP